MWIVDAAEAHSEPECQCCGRALKGRARWLELDQRDNSYHDRGDVPADRSQGLFLFGMACARRVNGKPNFGREP